MATNDDRRAALLLLLLALAGALVRLAGGGGGAPGSVGYRSGGDTRPDRDSLVAAAGRLSRPLAPGERIDLDRADAGDLARLPRIGPALAARIVTDRDQRGPFGSLEELRRVPGVGAGLSEAIRPHSLFSGEVRRRASSSAAPGKVSLNTATFDQLQQLPGIGPVKARAIIGDRRRNGPYRVIEDLKRVSGIGMATIERLRGFVIAR